MPIVENFDHTQFAEVSETLMNKSVLVVKDKRYRLCEIEFYYRGVNHDDTYTHSITDQMEFGYFYFHRYKNGSYKGGTYKGMDLTFGNKKEKIYCGVLIRSMMDIATGEFIEGPCKCVNKVLDAFDCKNVADFVEGRRKKREKKENDLLNIHDEKTEFYIEDKTDLGKENIYCGKRVGLSDKYPDYVDREYRFATMIKKIKKQKKFKLVTE